MTELVVNDDVIDILLTNSGLQDASGGNHVWESVTTANTVTSLKRGDHVFIRVHSRYLSASINTGSKGYSTFSGWLIH